MNEIYTLTSISTFKVLEFEMGDFSWMQRLTTCTLSFEVIMMCKSQIIMNDQMMKLNKNNNGDCKITHNILMMDDEFGECAKLWCGSIWPQDGVLQVIHQVTRGMIILSMFGTKKSIHIKHGLLVTSN